MSRRSHRHGERGHARPHRPEIGYASHPSPLPGPAETAGGPERPASVVIARTTLPPADATAPILDGPPAQGSPPLEVPPVTPPPASAPVASALTDPEIVAGGAPGPARPSDAPLPVDAMRPSGCTSPQLRRFIKSRAYIPMHELRRRFAIDGPEDDVAAIDIDGTRLYVGLPEREGRLLAELLRGGDVGAELSYDPVTPIIVGVYPMRPVPRS